jgi:hypothetical protein
VTSKKEPTGLGCCGVVALIDEPEPLRSGQLAKLGLFDKGSPLRIDGARPDARMSSPDDRAEARMRLLIRREGGELDGA